MKPKLDPHLVKGKKSNCIIFFLRRESIEKFVFFLVFFAIFDNSGRKKEFLDWGLKTKFTIDLKGNGILEN